MVNAEKAVETSSAKAPGLLPGDYFLLWGGLVVWTGSFLAGILINSAPYRESISSLSGPLSALLRDALVVATTYTYTNVAILCLLAGLLGTLARRSQLGTDEQRLSGPDTINPRSSAVLRGFLVYLALIAGVLILGDDPAQPTQKGYVRLAGLISLLSFTVNARPAVFGKLLHRVGETFDPPQSRLRN
jgi:hypothetical protein